MTITSGIAMPTLANTIWNARDMPIWSRAASSGPGILELVRPLPPLLLTCDRDLQGTPMPRETCGGASPRAGFGDGQQLPVHQ
jgi:hypothetical protein